MRLRAEVAALTASVHAEKLGEVAAEFDRIHSVERARDMGSLTAIIAADRLRAYVIDAIGRGVVKELARTGLPR